MHAGPDGTVGYRTIRGGLNSTASSDFTLQIYYSYPVGLTVYRTLVLVKTLTVRTNSSGNAAFEFDYFHGSMPVGDASYYKYLASATDAAGNTSSLSASGYAQLVNLSTRGHAGSADDALIAGFIIHRPAYSNGTFSKRLLLRALGPSLSVNGAPLAGTLPDPYLELRDGNGALLLANDNWRESSQAQEITATGAAPTNDRESALIANLGDGAYTAQVRGTNGTSGTGLVEVYDAGQLGYATGALVNLSTRGRVTGNDDILIGGLLVSGDGGERVLVRAIGPDLTGQGIAGALADPTLELRDGSGTLLAANDDWEDTQQIEIQQTTIAPKDDRDSAILNTLVPGAYTAIVRGKNGNSGVALVEFYTLKQDGSPSTARAQ